jgi:hypothetical protein
VVRFQYQAAQIASQRLHGYMSATLLRRTPPATLSQLDWFGSCGFFFRMLLLPFRRTPRVREHSVLARVPQVDTLVPGCFPERVVDAL